MCTVTLWDGAMWELQHCAHSGDHVLCTVLSSKPPSPGVQPVLLRVMNCHLPLEVGRANVPDRSKSMATVLGLLGETPASQVALVVGDLKLDLAADGAVQELSEAYQAAFGVTLADQWNSETMQTPLLSAVVPGSSLYDWTRGTLDAAVMAPGLGETETLPAMPSGSILRRWDPLNGMSSEEFISKCINYNLQDQVRQYLSSFSADDLGRLGSHHFGDQAEELSRFLEERPKAREELESPANDAHIRSRLIGVVEAPVNVAAKASSPSIPQSMPNTRAFGIEARQEFIRKHIHWNLHSNVAVLTDEDLRLLGLLHFSEQPAELQRFLNRAQSRGHVRAAVCGPDPKSQHGGHLAATRNSTAKGRVEGLAEWLNEMGLEEYGEAWYEENLPFTFHLYAHANFAFRSLYRLHCHAHPSSLRTSFTYFLSMLQGCNSLVQRHGCHLALGGAGERPRPCRSFRSSTIGAATLAESLGSTG